MVQCRAMKKFTARLKYIAGSIGPQHAWLAIKVVLVLALVFIPLQGSHQEAADQTEQVRTFTRDIEFDFGLWTFDAFQMKLAQMALGTGDYLSVDVRKKTVLEYMDLVGQIQQAEGQLNLIYADPGIQDPEAASAELRNELDTMRRRRDQIAPVAESILQSQISAVVDRAGLTLDGQALPPVLYRSTPLPLALIISPRDVIRQDENISLAPDLPVDERSSLEGQVDRKLDVSSLVVEIGGVGTYPTMVSQTSNLNWLAEVVAHEWIHNYLTLRPLGVSYMESVELRIMNETVASIAGKELGLELINTYYPELAPPPAPAAPATPDPSAPAEPPKFDYREEMHITRLRADELLAEGKIDEAEAYMEERRQVFWENGYHHLRKLNQAYFAFHGAYADEPGGASGKMENPVGEAVRKLRAQSASLEEFLNRIAWFNSFDDLLIAVGEKPPEPPGLMGN
jgi:hypothetical protein